MATLAACSSSSKNAGSSPTTAASTTTVTGAPTSSGDLERLLVSDVPAGFTLQADDVGDTGPSDLAKAIRDDDDPRTGKALRAERFVRGYQRLWIGPKDAQLVLFVYQFATPAGAKKEFERTKKALLAEAPPGAKEFSIPGIPSTSAVGIAGTSSDLSAAIVLFTTGPFTGQLVANGPALAGLQARATKVTQDQYQRLQLDG